MGKLNVKKLAVITGFLVLGLAGCAVNPVTGQSEIALVSDREAIAIGQQQYVPSQQMQGGQLLIAPELSAYVEEVGQRLARASGVNLPYEFVVLNNGTPNAWALPGGKIAINRGLLVALEHESELAAVLAHEIAHAAARHGAKRLERDMLTQGVLAVASIGTEGSALGQEVIGYASRGAQLLGLKYSRDAEREADFYGMQFMTDAGYSPQGAVTLQEKFVAMKGGAAAASQDWLASHPTSIERVENNRGRARELMARKPTATHFGTAEYRTALTRVTEAAPAYEAYEEASALLEVGSHDAAISSINQALSLVSDEAQFHGLRGAIRMAQKRYGDAVTNFDRAISFDPAYFAYYLHRGAAKSKQGKRSEAKQDLERSMQLLPTAQAQELLQEISAVPR
ncbi:MAG: M48 family metalloprotease [Pseudomonadales bacterium]|nr:M48 family metalloprotease [Pseudomonadales bacterium]